MEWLLKSPELHDTLLREPHKGAYDRRNYLRMDTETQSFICEAKDLKCTDTKQQKTRYVLCKNSTKLSKKMNVPPQAPTCRINFDRFETFINLRCTCNIT